MAAYVKIRNDQSGEIKQLKIGWSWTLLFFSQFFGLPLFMRKLHSWGSVFLILALLGLAITFGEFDEPFRSNWNFRDYFFAIVPNLLNILIAVKGNEITARNYLAHGWSFADPNGTDADFANIRWKLDQKPPWWFDPLDPWGRRKRN